MRILGSTVLFVLLSASGSAFAQIPLALPGCEQPPEVRQGFQGPLSQDALTRLTLTDRITLEQQTLDKLQAEYPREYSIYEQQWMLAQQRQIAGPDQAATDAARQKVDALRDAWVKNAKDHPDDALSLLLAAKIQIGKDTPEAIRLLEAAHIKAREFPWPAHELALLYSRGKFADDAKMRENVEAFYSLCPAWTPDTTYNSATENIMLQKDLPLMTKTVAGLRARLDKEADPKSLENYQVLWQREFLTRPPGEHDALRAQIKQDLKRLEAAVPNGDATWRAFLIEGYKLSGASRDELAGMQDAVAHDFPHATAAERKLWDQWNKAHPRPDGQKDLEAWKAYYAADVDQTKAIIHDFPDDAFARSSSLLQIALDDEFISREDGIAALDRYQQMMDKYGPFGTLSFGPADPARFLLDHGWQPERALELLKKTSTWKDGGHSQPHWSDDIADSDIRRFKRNNDTEDRANLGLILKAAALAGKPEEALKFRAAIEEAAPTDKNALEQYWTNRARLAALDKRPQDATAYYRLALDTRTHQPEYRHGLLRDNLTAEFHDLWRAQGGSEEAWLASRPSASAAATSPSATAAGGNAVLTKNAATAKKPDAQGDWRNAPKDLLPFQLSDFSGKTWGLKDFSGKVIMITTWATWCEWCRLEDQYLEKFYEKEKGRKDLAILSFDLDENPGQVLPFMQQQGYTFPVLAAFSIPESMSRSLPRTWIIDPNGNWLWEKDGYDESQAYADFEKEMLGRIDKAKAGQ